MSDQLELKKILSSNCLFSILVYESNEPEKFNEKRKSTFQTKLVSYINLFLGYKFTLHYKFKLEPRLDSSFVMYNFEFRASFTIFVH